jgi:hypothetical protein
MPYTAHRCDKYWDLYQAWVKVCQDKYSSLTEKETARVNLRTHFEGCSQCGNWFDDVTKVNQEISI